MTVVTVSVRGVVEEHHVDPHQEVVEAWLAARPDWEAAGNPRLAGYRSERAASPPVLRGADPGAPDRAEGLRPTRSADAAAHPGAQRPHHGQPIRSAQGSGRSGRPRLSSMTAIERDQPPTDARIRASISSIEPTPSTSCTSTSPAPGSRRCRVRTAPCRCRSDAGPRRGRRRRSGSRSWRGPPGGSSTPRPGRGERPRPRVSCRSRRGSRRATPPGSRSGSRRGERRRRHRVRRVAPPPSGW